MSQEKKIKQRRKRRTLRVRKAVKVSGLPRISVFRSLNHLYGQVIDDNTSQTIASCSTLELGNMKGDKKVKARVVGKELAKRVLEKGVSVACFDRGPFLYHGRVKEFAEGLREGGLKI